MKQYLIDTNLIVDVLRGYQESAKLVNSLPNANISIVSWYELIEGVDNLKQQKALEDLLSSYDMVDLSESIAKSALNLMLKYNLSHSLHHADALIAATCLEHGYFLCTRNIKHFQYIEGLKL